MIVRRLEIMWLYYDFYPGSLETQRFYRERSRWPPYDDGTWVEFWDVVATKMPGLLELRASLDVRLYSDHQSADVWMKPMLEVHRLRSCKIELKDCDEGDWYQREGPWERAPDVMCLERKLEDHMCGRALFTARPGLHN